MPLTPRLIKEYHVFLASPGDVNAERQHVRRFFDDYNRSTAHLWNARFVVIDWENYATTGVGRPQELITQQTLEKYKSSLALVVGIMGQRFGSPTGVAESGTEEEFNWAIKSNKDTGFPEIKWFFRKADNLQLPPDPDEAMKAVEQWRKVLAFRRRMQDFNNPVFYTEYPGPDKFRDVFDRDLNLWLADSSRPWAKKRAAEIAAAAGSAASVALPAHFDSERYRSAVLKQFDKLNFEMLDTTGAFYSGVRLWSVFIPQSARECQEYNPRLLEIPKEHQDRLQEFGELSTEELTARERQAEDLRLKFLSQPVRPVLEVIEEALQARSWRASRRLVILGDPGSGKSSLVRYLALRWADIADPEARDAVSVPLVIELGRYARWQCEGQKGLLRFLEEGPVWHKWPEGALEDLLKQAGRAVLLLDGLDEIFDVRTREHVVNDIVRFSNEHSQTPVIVTSRVVGYRPQLLRNAEFRHFMLQDLDAKQIDAFIDRWHEETFDSAEQAAPKRKRLKTGIHNSKSIAMLGGNPLLLTMMAILNRTQELPRDRVDLYGQASRLLLQTWDTERALEDFPNVHGQLGWREKTEILRRVASRMLTSPAGFTVNFIERALLKALIEDYLQTELHYDKPRATAEAVLREFCERSFVLCSADDVHFSFVYRAFLEYFRAADIVYKFNVSRTLTVENLAALFEQHCSHDVWREVLLLVCGQIDESFVDRVVEHLLTRVDIANWDGRAAMPELQLAVLCLNEGRDTSKLRLSSKRVRDAIHLTFRVAKEPFSDFVRDLMRAVAALGGSWPILQLTMAPDEKTVETPPEQPLVLRTAVLAEFPTKVDFVLITALEEEFDAVMAQLPNSVTLPPSNEDIRVYTAAHIPVTFTDGRKSSYSAVLLQLLNMGRLEAANATNDAIRRWQPRYVILIGIAGGIKAQGVALGDVIVSDQIVDYELQKITPTGPEIRYWVNNADPRLIGWAKHLLRGTEWHPRIKVQRPGISGTPRRIVGPIATGDKVIAFMDVLERYRAAWPRLLGVEMEAGGVARACYQAHQSPGFFMVRTVSDLADENKDSPFVTEWRSYVCHVAAAYAIAFLESGPVKERERG